MNKQREAVYGLRRQLLEGVDQKRAHPEDYVAAILSNILDENAPENKHADQWNIEGLLTNSVFDQFGVSLSESGESSHCGSTATSSATPSLSSSSSDYDVKEKILGAPAMRYHERMVMLSVLDGLWKDHLLDDGPPQGRHRPARLCAAGSAGGLQEESPSTCSKP